MQHLVKLLLLIVLITSTNVQVGNASAPNAGKGPRNTVFLPVVGSDSKNLDQTVQELMELAHSRKITTNTLVERLGTIDAQKLQLIRKHIHLRISPNLPMPSYEDVDSPAPSLSRSDARWDNYMYGGPAYASNRDYVAQSNFMTQYDCDTDPDQDHILYFNAPAVNVEGYSVWSYDPWVYSVIVLSVGNRLKDFGYTPGGNGIFLCVGDTRVSYVGSIGTVRSVLAIRRP